MADAATIFIELRKALNRIVYVLRNDREVAVKARTILVSVLAAVGIVYAGYVLFVEPQLAILNKKNHEYHASNDPSSQKAYDVLVASCQDLKNKDEELQEEIGVLQLLNESMKELWRGGGDKQTFFPVVLALHPSAPTKLAQGMVKLGQLAAVKQDNLTIFPVNIEGRASYGVLLAYLQYLERRP
ncbi:MAG: hypothetical protein OEV91_06695, partial [Desulfobulbaceae bacterium]|nr:hypothetical protein [Desulfobulbaceae bacterium]HIJ91731.1 hypothetical protein [Deltaproteobacteria bacterium]